MGSPGVVVHQVLICSVYHSMTVPLDIFLSGMRLVTISVCTMIVERRMHVAKQTHLTMGTETPAQRSAQSYHTIVK